MAYTPGPWKFEPPMIRSMCSALGKGACRVAEISIAYKDTATFNANAALIAAAPETAAERDRLLADNRALTDALCEAKTQLAFWNDTFNANRTAPSLPRIAPSQCVIEMVDIALREHGSK